MGIKISGAIIFVFVMYGTCHSQNSSPVKQDTAREFVCLLPQGTDAKFPGGQTALKRFICDHPEYPADSLLPDTGVEGTVIAEFTIDEQGKVINPRISNGIGYGYDEYVLRLIAQMPRWMPAEYNGKRVKAYRKLPVTFKASPLPGEDACFVDSSVF